MQHGKMIQGLRDAVYICDAAGYLTMFNNAAAELWGTQPSIGKDMYVGPGRVLDKQGNELTIENQPPAISIRENKPVDAVEIFIERVDGSRRHVLHSSAPIYDINGELAGAVNLLIDMTDRNWQE